MADGGSQLGTALGAKAVSSVKSHLAEQVLQALPPEVQDILKPGPQSDRINKAIGWAARRDPTVIDLHREHGAKQVHSLEDVRKLPLAKMDDVAEHIARRYRGRALLTGAVTGLPGGLWALAAAGADVQLTAIYAVRMAAGVAQAYGYDTSTPEELAHLAEVLALVAGVDSLRGIGNWLTREGLMVALPDILPKLLARIGTDITKEQASKAVGRLVPGVGAVVGGAIDYSFLRVAGDKAIRYYHDRYLADHGLGPAPSAQAGSAIAAMPAGTGKLLLKPGAPAVPVIPHSTPKPRERPPEHRLGRRLAFWAVFSMLITIALCAGIVIAIELGASSAFSHLFH